jgi:uncharacterized protein (DUF362 family)
MSNYTQSKKIVAVQKVYGEVKEAVFHAMASANWKSFIKQGADVALKVNLGWDLFIPGSITSPLVVEGVIITIRDWVGHIYIVEADQVLENVEKAFLKSKMFLLCEKYGVQWVNLSKEKTITMKEASNQIFKETEIPEILLKTQMITIPVMKTHDKTVITGAIKNQFGCLNKLRYKYHSVLDDALPEINSFVSPKFAVMDATVCLEGNGPKSGIPKVADLILASSDFVALDTVQALLMGFNPIQIKHIQNCARIGLGVANSKQIEIVGLDVKSQCIQFKPAKHNLISQVELYLTKSPLYKLFFETPIFNLCLALAKLWYYIWNCFKGRKYWREILDHPVYGQQWR